MRFESTGSWVNFRQLAWRQGEGLGDPRAVPSTPEPRLSRWGWEESLTGHVALVQLLEGEGDIVQFRQGHPDVLQHGPFLFLQEQDRVEESQVPPLPQVSLQDTVIQL